MIKKLFSILIAVTLSATAFGQVGIGTNTITSSEILKLESTTQALVITRVPSTSSIATPIDGMFIFDQSSSCFKLYQASAWTGCMTTGGAGLSPTTNGTAVATLLNCSAASAGSMYVGSAVSGVTQTITVNVTVAGTYNLTATANGVTFTAAGTWGSIGNKTVVLNATGTPASSGVSSYTMDVTPSCSFTRQATVVLNVSPCVGKPISATSCSAILGATLNDDVATTEGVEYDWSNGGTLAGFANNTRSLVEIGGQCWFRKGMNLPSATGQSGYLLNAATEEFDGAGRYYNWNAAMNGSKIERAKGVCPSGFHIPSDCEINYLENTLGGIASGTAVRKLTSNTAPHPAGGTSTNLSGMNFHLTGSIDNFATGNGYNVNAYFFLWSSTGNGTEGTEHFYTGTSVAQAVGYSAYGETVRCIAD